MADNIFPREILGELKPLVAITCLAEAEGDKIKEADLLRQLRPKAFHVASLKSTPFGSLSAYLQHKHCAPGSSFARKQSYDGTPQTGSTGSGGGSGSSSSSNTAGSSAGAGLGDSTGIIKCNWFQKRVNLMPAAVLAFFVSSGSDQDWKTKENELAALMETERKFFKARGIRLLLVLVLANGENILAVEEKLSSLKKRVDLDTKQVIIATPNIDVQNNYVTLDLYIFFLFFIVTAACYYYFSQLLQLSRHLCLKLSTNTSKRKHGETSLFLEASKSLLMYNKILFASTTSCKYTFFFFPQPNTQIRLSIKVAYLSELRKDFHNAIKYYKNSSALLNDLKFAYDRDWPRVYEIKEVLSMVNFRICYIMFVENKTTREAVQQFQNHIRTYKSSVAIPYMETLHWTSIEAQLLAFGKLLASQKSIIHRERGSYHPAHYFHEAAHALILRKKAAAHQYDTYRSKPSVAIARQALEDTPADKRAEFLTRSPSSKYFFHFEKIRPQKSNHHKKKTCAVLCTV